MVSFNVTFTLIVYMGFILYGLHSQSRLLKLYFSQLDEEESHSNDELVSMPKNKTSRLRIRKGTSVVYRKFRQSAKQNQSKPTFSTDASRKQPVQTRQSNRTKPTLRSSHHPNHTKPSFQALHRPIPQNGTSTSPVRKWAYAFLVGGCGQTKPEYKGFIYNVAVAAQRFRELGSAADVLVFVQMSVHTEEIELPEEETRLLESNGVRIIYLPKFARPVHEKFYALVQEKFRILELTDYSRVLFLDSDIMPLCSMDYMFELSEPETGEPTLKENVVLAWRLEPANAGFFMMKPDLEDFASVQDAILKREEKALTLPWPHWDPVEGWGHVIEASDAWRTPDRVIGTNWTWHAVFADQGLLYYWTKYVKQSVSLIINKDIENWGSKNGTFVLESTNHDAILNEYTCVPPVRGKYLFGNSPYRDFKHFTGRSKPWQQNQSSVFETMSMEGEPILPAEKWYRALAIASKKADVQLNFSFATEGGHGDPPVGRFSDYGTMINHIKAKRANNWTAYEDVGKV
eukprot:CAMPEP_0117006838 /NCGR_PEP_ID=MMETSP0472-20121206/6933_1 /TAXON_ID=693140 ORGANISM="Tiarina fusus, Strain LIS" /NCGR_SAMPLE_ID=MMETSP0472 /ASSEMBLY_ACC=CAM_ASM_000603 /LENGTH=514 /DNA_ID=CAMNT_0004708437 /DNA_START=125 /DNA_END=1669 /DNA_ORIENTATION=+